jgi:crotonobetainyl-CoA:carnitine CoA-transferase CaiB-like acyl-CoA transferase
MLPGGFCTLALAMLGADVIKVEDRGAGDYQREFGHKIAGASASHHVVNRNKRSIALDLKSSDDREVFEELVGTAQVLVESFRPGTMRKLGYPAEELHRLQPSLVIADISGYGADGPLAHSAGHDINFLAFSGLLDRMGEPGRPPIVPPVPIADLLGGGLLPALMIVACLRRAESSGRGSVVDVSIAEAMAVLPGLPLTDLLAGDKVRGRGELDMSGGLACYSVYATLDGYVAVGALEDRFWQQLCDVAQLPQHRSGHLDLHAQAAIRTDLEAFFATRTKGEIERMMSGRDACVTPVLSYEEMVVSDHAHDRSLVAVDSQPFPMPAFPVVLDGARLPEGRPAPTQGEHSTELLAELARVPHVSQCAGTD